MKRKSNHIYQGGSLLDVYNNAMNTTIQTPNTSGFGVQAGGFGEGNLGGFGTADLGGGIVGAIQNQINNKAAVATALLPGIIDNITGNPAEAQSIRSIRNAYIDDATALGNTQFAGGKDTLLRQSANLPVWQDVTADDFGGKTDVLTAGLSGAVQGGVSAAPTGNVYAIGAAALVNGITNAMSAGRKNKRIHRATKFVNRVGSDAEARALDNFNMAIANTDAIDDRWQLQNMYNNNIAAFGGTLETKGTTWSTGVDFIENGGSHEENPFEGVPYGMASDGLPNLVEEGEVVLDLKDNEGTSKYVLSKRVKPNDEELDNLRLITRTPEKYKGQSYADIYKDLLKKNNIDELVNRKDAKDYLDILNARIIEAQEATKLREYQEELMAALKKATPEQQDMIMQQLGMQTVQPMQGEYLAAEGGKIFIKPSKRGTFTAAAKKRGMGVQEFASKVLANKEDYSPAMVKKANFARNFGGHKHQDGGLYSVRQSQTYKNPGTLGKYLPYTVNDPTFLYWGKPEDNVNGYTQGYYNFATNPDNYTPDSKLMQSLQKYYNDKGFKGTLAPEKAMSWATDRKGGGFHDIVAQAFEDSQRPAYYYNPLEKADNPINSYFETPSIAPIENISPQDNLIVPKKFEYSYLGTKPTLPEVKEEDNTPVDVSWVLPATSGATVLSDMLGLSNIPDYSNATRIGRAILPPNLIGYDPSGRYMKPQLVDTRYLAARLANQANTGISAAKDLSGATPATALANIAAQNYLGQQAAGQAIATGQEYNNKALQTAIANNNAVDLANAQGTLQADEANQKVLENYAERYANQKTKEAMLRESIDTQVATNRSANWNNLLENLQGYFDNQRNLNMVNQSLGRIYGYTEDAAGNINWDKVSKRQKQAFADDYDIALSDVSKVKKRRNNFYLNGKKLEKVQ